MNIKGKSRAGGRELADHLLNAEKNETVKILSVNGTVAQDLHGAFYEMEAIASGTRCKKPLYHAKISPDPKEPALTPEQWNRAIAELRDQLGLVDHAYAAVLHRKYGAAHPDLLREHVHVVFNRIDPDTMLAMHDGHNYRKHELVARQLEREFGHARIQGAHVERDDVERPPRTPPDWAMQQAVKSGIHPRAVADTVKQLWNETDSPRSFAVALTREGLTLAVGRRDLVVLDAAGDVHTLARCLNLKVADIRERMAGIDRSQLPTVDEARDAIRERNAEKTIPAPGTLAGGSERKPGLMPATDPGAQNRPANDNRRDRINIVAALLYEKSDQKQPPANDAASEREKMAAFGFDAAQPGAQEKWLELGGKVDAGRITEKDRLREMAQYLWEQADKERRTEPNQPARDRPKEPDRDR